ncbi:MAG: hypothetical protein ACM3L8_04295 [Verrucomicrobiota bacterium]
MTTLRTSSAGQSLLESVLLLPLLLCLLAGGYWTFRQFAFSGAAESAAQAHLLRSGRALAPIGQPLSRTIHPKEDAVRLRKAERSLIAEVPFFRGMSGNTIGSAEPRCPVDPVGAYLPLPPHSVHREAEAAVDCWGWNTRSGSRIRGSVQAVVLTGSLR